MIPVVLGIIIVVFTLLYLAPGDAVDIILSNDATEEQAAELRHEMGLDRPYIVQLGRYLWQLVQLDFGKSAVSNVPVMEDLKLRAPLTLGIGCASIVITAFFGIGLGIIAAINQNKWPDAIATIFALVGASLPAFFFALLLVLVIAYRLHWLPAYGMGGIEYYILPVFSNALGGVAMLARQTRSSMLEVSRADYINMARSKGVSRKNIVLRHMLPNAMIPVATTIGMQFAGVLGGGLIVETVFSIPGMGFFLASGCSNRDYNVVMACTIVISVVFCIIMLLVDLAMAGIDPNIRAQFVESTVWRGGKRHA